MASNEILELYKQIGETPLECIHRFKEDNPEYKDQKMTYLGRLDPMAEGLLLVLSGGMMKKEEFLQLDKTYEFEVLWGFGTDTYDVLGKVVERGETPKKIEMKIPDLLNKIGNKKTQAYPAYSSRTVGGKPLFQWARENRVEEIDIPTRGIKIFSIDHIHTRYISNEEMLDEITSKVNLVKGDFRQEEILKGWQDQLLYKSDRYLISKFVANVSSGTYIRGLAHDMGKLLDTSALAYSIKRTQVGEYRL